MQMSSIIYCVHQHASILAEMGESGDLELRLFDAAEHDCRQNIQQPCSVSSGMSLIQHNNHIQAWFWVKYLI